MKGQICIGSREYISLDRINKILKSSFKEGFTSYNATDLMKSYCRNKGIYNHRREWSNVWLKMVKLGMIKKEQLEGFNSTRYHYYWVKEQRND